MTRRGALVPTRDKIIELKAQGFYILKNHFDTAPIDTCREAFWPMLLNYLEIHHDQPNRGPNRHFLPVPFSPPCFAPEFFFDASVLNIVRSVMDERVVADQWGCDVPVKGSMHQGIHVDYQRPLFPEMPNILLPPYMLVVSFSLIDITNEHGPLELAPGTHLMPREEALRAVEHGEIQMHPVLLEKGDVLIRHPWALHRGSPNLSDTPRALLTIRYVRHWYADASREISAIPRPVWDALTAEEQNMMRFPLEG